jgi:hypothetical protein
MADHPISDHPKTDKRTFISDEERALMDSLLQVGFDAINHHSSYAQPPTNSRYGAKHIILSLAEFVS